MVYDKGAGRVTHYLDGQPVAEEWVEFEIPLRVAEAELGSWNLASHRNRTPVRFFSGCIDEFVIFSRPLGGGEVERLYTQGRPPYGSVRHVSFGITGRQLSLLLHPSDGLVNDLP